MSQSFDGYPVGFLSTLPEGLGFISFRPPPPCGMRSLFLRGQRKEIKRTLSACPASLAKRAVNI